MRVIASIRERPLFPKLLFVQPAMNPAPAMRAGQGVGVQGGFRGLRVPWVQVQVVFTGNWWITIIGIHNRFVECFL